MVFSILTREDPAPVRSRAIRRLVMELALQLHVKNVDLDLYLLPRLQNIEADSLTNDDTTKFDPRYRVRFDLQKFEGLILSEMLETGVGLYEEIKNCKAVKQLEGAKKIRKEDTLRVKDPWP